MRFIAVPIVATLGLALALPSGAVADKSVAPPGNSGISQYLEVVPTAGGNKPAKQHPRSGHVLNHHQNKRLLKVGGTDGQRLANLVNATAPTSGNAASSASTGHGKHKGKSKHKSKAHQQPTTTTSSSDDRQARAVAAAYGNGGDGGGGAGSGIGVPLIVLMGAAALLVGAAALGRRLAGGGGGGGSEGEPQL